MCCLRHTRHALSNVVGMRHERPTRARQLPVQQPSFACLKCPATGGCLGRESAQLRCMQRFCCVLLKRHPYTAASRGSQSLQDMTPAYSVRNVDRSVELLVCPLCSGLRGTPRPVPSHGLKSVLKPGCGECAGAACRPCCPPSPCAGGWRGQERRCAGQGGRRSSMRLRSQSCCP